VGKEVAINRNANASYRNLAMGNQRGRRTLSRCVSALFQRREIARGKQKERPRPAHSARSREHGSTIPSLFLSLSLAFLLFGAQTRTRGCCKSAGVISPRDEASDEAMRLHERPISGKSVENVSVVRSNGSDDRESAPMRDARIFSSRVDEPSWQMLPATRVHLYRWL